MALGYVPLASDDADRTYLPVESDDVVAVVQLNGLRRNDESVYASYLVVPCDGQEDVSARNRTFDLIGPLHYYGRGVATLLGDRLESMPQGQAAIDGSPRHATEAWGVPRGAARVLDVQFPGAHFRTHCLVYPLAEEHEAFGSAVEVYLYEEAGREVGALIDG